MNEMNAAVPEAPFTLAGKTAIVAGGGRGIGRAIARLLASWGAQVLACDLDRETLQETQSSVAHPERIAVYCGDLMEPAVLICGGGYHF